MTDMESTDTLLRWLDTTEADQGLTVTARNQLSKILNDEDAYDRFADVILSPPADKVTPEVQLARSYRALHVLMQDCQQTAREMQPPEHALMNSTQAGLLTKRVLNALDKDEETTVLIHKRALLDALLDAFPAKVVSAACAGGQEGMEAHLRPLMSSKTCHQTLPTLTTLVLYGCTGKKGRASAEKTAQAVMMEKHLASSGGKPIISHGHRRKFVKVLSDWGFLSRLSQCIVEESHSETSIGLGEEACEALLTIVECIGYQDAATPGAEKEREAVNEEVLLNPLGQAEWWDPLMKIVSDQEHASEASRVAATRTIVGVFGLATGHSTRILASRAPTADKTESVEGINAANVEKEANSAVPKDNKLRRTGLTTKIHLSLVSHVPEILKALTVQEIEDDTSATVYFQRGDDVESVPLTAMPHPGRCLIVPFTSWRLQVVTLLAELVSYVDDESPDGEASTESPRVAAMNALMELSLPVSLRKPGDETPSDDDNESALNPWPTLCEWVFQYPENNLYHVQFLRLFQAICFEHHESTLRLVLQKIKFVSRAVRTCKSVGPLRGVLLSCLNTLRLRSESLPPSAFLRQFLDSHDAWKGFQETLLELTVAQQTDEEKSTGINLGGKYASKMGFDRFETYNEAEENEAIVEASSGAKKKKKGKKKRKK